MVNTRTNGFMAAFGALINPYQGCTFGCSYCYAAGTTFTRNRARSADWGNWVDVKQNGQEVGAATRIQALDIARQLHQLPKDATERQTTNAYRGAYINGLRRIKPKLEEMGASVGTNREGFKPPF